MWTIEIILQYLAWFISLPASILGIYVFYLNPRGLSNRIMGLLLLVLAPLSYAIGGLHAAVDEQAAYLPTLIIAGTSGALGCLLLLAPLALFKPAWLRNPRFRPAVIGLFALALLPAVLTLLDAATGTRYYYSGLEQALYGGGYTAPSSYLQGSLAPVVNLFAYIIPAILTVIFLLYTALFDRTQSPTTRRTAAGLILATLMNPLLVVLTGAGIYQPYLSILVPLVILVPYGLVAFFQLGPEQRRAELAYGVTGQERVTVRTSLAQRLTIVTLIVTTPLLAAMAIFLTNRMQAQLRQDALNRLESANHAALEAIEIWLGYNTRALKTLALNREITGMDPATQETALRTLVSTYPYMYLASTTDMAGMNIARSDAAKPTDYKDRRWFKESAIGRAVTYQAVIGRTSGRPAMVLGMPIRDEQNDVIGVAMFASELTEVSKVVLGAATLEGSQIFLADEFNQVLAHSNAQVEPLADFTENPVIKLVSSGQYGSVRFQDENGEYWMGYANILSNGWRLVVQQSETTLFAPIRAFQQLGLLVMLFGLSTLLALIWFTMRQSLAPVKSLTDTATAITAGDIARVAPVESQDELGVLAETFNAMTSQMRDLIGGLENRVSERTRDLERRATQLQVAADVSRETAAIRDPGRLLNDVTQLISERLGHYHVGIFLIEGQETEAGTGEASTGAESGYAVLKAANSEGGQKMLARGHRLKVGQVGIVGYVCSAGRPRIALDVGRDAVFFNNPDLPSTRSEMALPLKVQNRVIGALDVQSRRPSAFTEEDTVILQVLADQVALAIENARLINESQRSLQELESLYGMQVTRGWQQRLGNQPLYYRLAGGYVQKVAAEELGHSLSAAADLAAATPGDGNGHKSRVAGPEPTQGETGGTGEERYAEERYAQVIEEPIALRGHPIGKLHLRRSTAPGSWSAQDEQLVKGTLAQLALALENNRLLEEIQERARREEQVNYVVSRAQSSMNMEAVMRTAVRELGEAINAAHIRIRLGSHSEQHSSAHSGSADDGSSAAVGVADVGAADVGAGLKPQTNTAPTAPTDPTAPSDPTAPNASTTEGERS